MITRSISLIFLLVIVFVATYSFLTGVSLNQSEISSGYMVEQPLNRSERSHTSDTSFDEILQNNVDDVVIPNVHSIHMVRLYRETPTQHQHSLCWLECVALLSIMLYAPQYTIYVHTNYPDFWPFDTCDGLIQDWRSVKLVYSRRRFVLNGVRMNRGDKFIAHEADIVKYMSVYKFGGIAVDFDVFFLPNVTQLLDKLKNGYDCIVSKEEDHVKKMNLGFLACHRGASYVADVLRAYNTDYHPDAWVYNSGEVPWRIHSESPLYKQTVYVDDEIANHPGWETIEHFTGGQLKINWRMKPAFHSFLHDCAYNVTKAREMDTGFAELLVSILDDAGQRKISRV
ncbi:uncharacterized protein LOC129595993 isoform X1 [Paramacrobiotus metropolitanus]|uniref:uncharacterized protein LOC129595993 isoform X1 n=1 Tax=Paramacrobiotus metropolitanus TaxID=2943436 RepID=UPI002446162F|nr:uncharacterized protein LOC129595993 isoform X1 [Paramacrobiotus metropolitanus]